MNNKIVSRIRCQWLQTNAHKSMTDHKPIHFVMLHRKKTEQDIKMFWLYLIYWSLYFWTRTCHINNINLTAIWMHLKYELKQNISKYSSSTIILKYSTNYIFISCLFVEKKVFLLSFHFSLGKISEAKKKESFNNFLSSKNTHFLFYFWIRNTYVCKQWETWAVLHRKQIKPKGVKFSISLLWKSSMYIKLNIIYYIWTVEMELYNFYRFPHQYF